MANQRVDHSEGWNSFGSDDFGSIAIPRSRHLPSWITPFRVLVTLAIAGSGLYAYVNTTTKAVSYRVAISKIGSVSQTIDAIASITPSSQSVVDFATPGTVATVPVTVGQKISVGDVLATLDSSNLNATVQSDNKILADDQLKLYNDLASQTTTTTSPPTTLVDGGQGSSIKQIQSQLTGAESSLASALAQADSICSAPAVSASSGNSTTSSGQVKSGSNQSQGTTSTIGAASPSPVSGKSTTATTCSSAIATASSASNQVSSLTAELNKAVSVATTQANTNGSGASTGSSLRGTQPPIQPATQTQIALDNANVSLAEANLQEANTALGLATLKAPIAGVVAAIGLSPGSTVNGTSNTSQFVIIGSGDDYDATFYVTPSQLPLLRLNQSASVEPDSTKTSVAGTISSIGAAVGTSTSPTYPVTVTFADPNLGHLSGDQAQVTISVATAANAVVVPTSAVSTDGVNRYVTEVNGSSTKRVAVSVGVVGSIYTQITAGLRGGQTVMLANNSLPIPATSSLTTRFGGFGGGGLKGGFGGGAGRVLRNALG